MLRRVIDTELIEQQLHDASTKLGHAAQRIRKARKKNEEQDPLPAQCAIVREATGDLVEAAQALHGVIQELENRTAHLVENA